MTSKLDQFNFSRGIEQVSHVDAGEAKLPLARPLVPPGTSNIGELDRVLALPDLHDRAVEALRPNITELEILSPGAFSAALLRSAVLLESKAASNSALEPAVRELQRQDQLLQLLAQYRSSIYAG